MSLAVLGLSCGTWDFPHVRQGLWSWWMSTLLAVLGSSPCGLSCSTRDQTHIPYAARSLNHWANKEFPFSSFFFFFFFTVTLCATFSKALPALAASRHGKAAKRTSKTASFFLNKISRLLFIGNVISKPQFGFWGAHCCRVDHYVLLSGGQN